MNKKTTGILAYITWIGWLIAFLAGDKEGAKFHLNQALVVNLASIVCGILGYIPVVNLVGGILGIVVFVFWVMGLIAAIREEEKPLPVIGNIRIIQ